MNKKLHLEHLIEQNWYTKHAIKSLQPLTVIYNIIIHIKKHIETKIFDIKQLNAKPIIIIGNLTAGGTGKTPFVIHLTQILKKIGFKPCIISKGYKGTFTKNQAIKKTDEASVVGDEALLIKKITKCMVIIGKKRSHLLHNVVKKHLTDILICDDGMQDYKLYAYKKISIIDGYRHFGNEQSIPVGPLRAKLNTLYDTDLNIVNNDKKLAKKFMIKIISQNFKNARKIFKINIFKNKITHAITALGNPNKFFSTLKKNKIKIKKSIFQNHYMFSYSDFKIKEHPILVTEKDSIKLKHIFNKNIWTIKITFASNANINIYISKIIKNR